MGVDDAEGRRFRPQMLENPGENHMLVDVGKVAGVKRMPIVHIRARGASRSGQPP
jgi:hypothetical protein